jgi:hypothetical protein
MDIPIANPTANSSSEIFPFLDLPLELRNAIYSYTLRWPDLSNIYHNGTLHEDQPYTYEPTGSQSPTLTTPRVLLLNHQITIEALAILYQKALVINSPCPLPTLLITAGSSSLVPITRFISATTLKHVRLVVLDVDLDYRTWTENGVRQYSSVSWHTAVQSYRDFWHEENRLDAIHVRVWIAKPIAGTARLIYKYNQCIPHLIQLVCATLC